MKLASCKSALTPPLPTPVVYSSGRSKAVVLVLFLLFVALQFPHCFLLLLFCLFFCCCFFVVFFVVVVVFFSSVVMLAFWSPSTAVHFSFCFTSCD